MKLVPYLVPKYRAYSALYLVSAMHQVICSFANSVNWKHVDICKEHLQSKAHV